MVDIMEKYKPCLDLGKPKVKEYKSDPFSLFSPTLHYSITPALKHLTVLATLNLSVPFSQ